MNDILLMLLFYEFDFTGLSVADTQNIHRVDFDYKPGLKALNPCRWGTVYPLCNAPLQSPVDLPKCSEEIKQPPLRFTNLMAEPVKVELIHMVHTPLVKYHVENPIEATGGPLFGGYHFDHYTIRWGESNTTGSEHTLGGKGFAGEVQLVFYTNQTRGFHEAVNTTDGIAIFSVWLEEVQTPDNFLFDELLAMLDYVTHPWSYTDLCQKLAIKYYLPEDRRRYYTYKGSLTYPPCYENVIWVIFQDALQISRYQIRKFRRMIGVRGAISKNNRPIQPTNGRAILKVLTDSSSSRL